MLRKMLGWGGGDVNVPCTCTHVGCYARCWVGVGGMLTFLALAHKSSTVCFSLHELLQSTAGTQVIDKMWGHFDDFLPKSIHNKSKATRLINDQIWEYLYSWQWRHHAGKDLWTNMHEVFAE